MSRRYFVDKDGHVFSYCGSFQLEEPELPPVPPYTEVKFPYPPGYPTTRAYLTKTGEIYIAPWDQKRNEDDRDISCERPAYGLFAAWVDSKTGEIYHASPRGKRNPEDVEIPPLRGPNLKWDGKRWAPNIEGKLRRIRIKRNSLLCATDWIELPNAPLTEEKKEAWREYRQKLRDFPAQITDEEIWEEKLSWPEPPERPWWLADLLRHDF